MGELLAANKNVKIIYSEKYFLFRYHGLLNGGECNTTIKIPLTLDETETYDEPFCLYLIMLLELSNIFRQRLKQKYYDKILNTAKHSFLLSVLNFIITENDIGIITKFIDSNK